MVRLLLLTSLIATAIAAVAPATAHAAYGDWSITSGADPVATIADLDASADAIAPGRAGGVDAVELTFRSTVAQHLRITVLDASGRERRSIVDTDIQAGPATWRWDGRDDAGVLVPDGAYELVVEAGSRADSMSVSDVVRVDRRAPAISTPSLRVRVPSLYATAFRLPIVASETALVDVSVAGASGRARVTSSRPKGRSSVAVPVARRAALRAALARGRARVRIGIVATDDAGNRTARTVLVELLPPGAPGGSGGGSQEPAPTSGRISWPLSGPVTSRFGPRWGRMHNGIDIGVPTGRAIGSAAPGRVTYAGWMSGYGTTVIVDHGTLDTLYAHQSRLNTRVGATVARGQVIGYVGSTGNSTGPHLHFEVRSGGVARNPLSYLS